MSYGEPIPRNRLEPVGYTFKCRRACNKCGQWVEWWLTKNKKSVPFDPAPTPTSPMNCHWETCPERGRQTANTPASQPTPAATAHDLGAAAESVAKQYNARLVIIFSDNDHGFAYQLGQSGEDLRSDCIQIGGEIRQQIGAQR